MSVIEQSMAIRFALLQRQNHIHPGDAALRHAARAALREPRSERVTVSDGGLLR